MCQRGAGPLPQRGPRRHDARPHRCLSVVHALREPEPVSPGFHTTRARTRLADRDVTPPPPHFGHEASRPYPALIAARSIHSPMDPMHPILHETATSALAVKAFDRASSQDTVFVPGGTFR